jgi:glutathione S-transferase
VVDIGDAEKLAAHNPLRRVPTLLLDSGEVLIESFAILDYLDERAGPEKALIARGGPDRYRALRICALSTGLADKAVSLLYERVLRKEPSNIWVERCQAQIGGVLVALEKERATIKTPFWFATRIGHTDIAAACALRLISEAHPPLFDRARNPALSAHAAACEALQPFQEIVQPLAPQGMTFTSQWDQRPAKALSHPPPAKWWGGTTRPERASGWGRSIPAPLATFPHPPRFARHLPPFAGARGGGEKKVASALRHKRGRLRQNNTTGNSRVGQITFTTSRRPASIKGVRVVTIVGCGTRWTLERHADERRFGGRQSRVVLAPRRWRQVHGGISASDSGKRARSRGRARNKL